MCLTDVAAILASPTAQEMEIPVNFSFPDASDNTATPVFGRHVAVSEN